MHWFYIIMPLVGIGSILLTFALYRIERLNHPSLSIEDSGEALIIRHSPVSRAFNVLTKTVNKINVVKVQRSKNCLSLFTASDSAYDIWLSEKHIPAHLEHVRRLIPQVDFTEVN